MLMKKYEYIHLMNVIRPFCDQTTSTGWTPEILNRDENLREINDGNRNIVFNNSQARTHLN